MKKTLGLTFTMLCLIVSVGLVFFNFHQASSKSKAGGSHSAKKSSSLSAEGVTFDLLSSSSSGGTTIFGNVSDSKRAPVTGKVVKLVSKSTVSAKKSLKKVPRITKKTTTDKHGAYSISGLSIEGTSDTFTLTVAGSKKKINVKILNKDATTNTNGFIINLKK